MSESSKAPSLKLDVPLFLALDVDDEKAAMRLAENTKNYVGGFKIGPRLVMASGSHFVRELSRIKPVFVDLKFYDIPNTMEAAVQSVFEAGATFVTVHSLAGKEALTRLARLEKDLNKKRPFKILAVTILTSFRREDLPPGFHTTEISEQVANLSRLAFSCGITGFVSSAEEVEIIKQLHPDIFAVTPGIRMKGQNPGDQQRVDGPLEALNKGADALVVGRPIVAARDPIEAAKLFYEQIEAHRQITGGA